MKLGPEGEKLIKSREGFSLKPYLDDAKIPTIGWGSIRLRDGSRVTMQTEPITVEEAQYLFDRDTSSAVGAVNHLITVELTQNQFDALVDFAYNVGNSALQQSALRTSINSNHQPSVDMFARWNKEHRNGILVVSDGLTKRRNIEFNLYQKAA